MRVRLIVFPPWMILSTAVVASPIRRAVGLRVRSLGIVRCQRLASDRRRSAVRSALPEPSSAGAYLLAAVVGEAEYSRRTAGSNPTLASAPSFSGNC
ncbi:MAG TPA: hypothetical protein DCQ98_06915 [Planctomycetaceae bacterium]|nr:hypothetical protein [Planctomycetaceae bacterium]